MERPLWESCYRTSYREKNQSSPFTESRGLLSFLRNIQSSHIMFCSMIYYSCHGILAGISWKHDSNHWWGSAALHSSLSLEWPDKKANRLHRLRLLSAAFILVQLTFLSCCTPSTRLFPSYTIPRAPYFCENAPKHQRVSQALFYLSWVWRHCAKVLWQFRSNGTAGGAFWWFKRSDMVVYKRAPERWLLFAGLYCSLDGMSICIQ